MVIERPLRPAIFLRRLNRFAVALLLDGREAVAHLPNSGRLGELLTPGRPALLMAPAGGRPRRTEGDVVFMQGPASWVSVDARLPGRLLGEAVEAERLSAFQGHRVVRYEYRPPYAPHSRLDLLLEGLGTEVAVETKSVTLVEEGTALFPDAPTLRGARHMLALVQALRHGQRACVVFVVQRPDVGLFSPHRRADPDFARALAQAAGAGVEVRAYACRVRPPSIAIEREIPVVLA